MLPSVSSKLYHALVQEMVSAPPNSLERARLSALQRKLSEAQQAMAVDKTLVDWQKAG